MRLHLRVKDDNDRTQYFTYLTEISSASDASTWRIRLWAVSREAKGWLDQAPVLDLFSRRVVGWAMADHMETSLVKDALCMGLAERRPTPRWIHHSDQGSQYTSEIYQQHLADHHCQVSMSRAGNCYDNATMESFIAPVK